MVVDGKQLQSLDLTKFLWRETKWDVTLISTSGQSRQKIYAKALSRREGTRVTVLDSGPKTVNNGPNDCDGRLIKETEIGPKEG